MRADRKVPGRGEPYSESARAERGEASREEAPAREQTGAGAPLPPAKTQAQPVMPVRVDEVQWVPPEELQPDPPADEVELADPRLAAAGWASGA